MQNPDRSEETGKAVARLSRRDFLRIGAAAAGSAAAAKLLAACGQQPTPTVTPTDSPLPTATEAAAPTPSIAGTAASTSAPTASAAPPDIAVARGGEPERLVRAALDSLGGMSRFVRQGANVVIKPNICVAYHTYEYAATTNPWVVGALVRLCLEAGAGSVKVVDSPFGGTQQAAYQISGIQEQVEAAGGIMVKTPAFKYTTARIPDAMQLKLVNIFEDVLQADTVINVPIAKTHGLARLTLGMKNLMGVVLDRPDLHPHLSENLADLASLVRPALTVVDAVRILVGNGPTGGSLDDVKQLDTVLASADLVAADSYAATLFGLQPDDLGYVVAGVAKGLGRSDLQNLRIEEIQLGSA
jgi:uncharacterized protein (DUF362 family)